MLRIIETSPAYLKEKKNKMSLFTNLKKNRPTVSLAMLKALGVPGLTNSKDADLGFENLLEKMMFASGLNHIVQVNDCETSDDWTESDNGTLDYAVGATGKRVGTNCLLLTNTAATDNSQYVATTYINESEKIAKKFGKRQVDWSDTKYLGFWVHNAADTGAFNVAGEASVAIVSNGVLQTKMPIQAIVDVVHQWFQVDMVAAGWDLTAVEELRFYANNSAAAQTLYIDDIIRYQIAYCGKPYYGCSIPVKSGVTITDGQVVGWSVDGAIVWASAAAVTDLGLAYLYGNSTLVGTAKRDKWAIVPGMHLVVVRANAATVAGEGLEFASASLAAGVSTGVDEKGCYKGLEAAGNQYDDIFALATFGGNFIS